MNLEQYTNKSIYPYICGVDEAGRGPLAGEVYAAAVILDTHNPIHGLRDSKKLSEKQRELLYDEIILKAISYSIGIATVNEIDSLNILNASLLAMSRAIFQLCQNLKLKSTNICPSIILVDGNKIPKLDSMPVTVPIYAVISGDSLVQEISAASILAKVMRDRAMISLDKMYPQYNFAKHKGYGTKLHMEAIARYGVLPKIHRTSFAPIKNSMSML